MEPNNAADVSWSHCYKKKEEWATYVDNCVLAYIVVLATNLNWVYTIPAR